MRHNLYAIKGHISSVHFNEFWQLYMVCSQHPKQDLEYVHILREFLCVSLQAISCPFPRSNYFLTFVTIVLPIFLLHTNGILVYFCVFVFFHSRQMFLWFIHAFLHTSNSLFYCWVVWHCVNTPQFAHILDDEYLDCFQFCAIMNKAAVNILMQVLFWTYVLISFG